MTVVKVNIFFVFLITLLIVGSLININIFGPPTLFAYFSYTIIGAFITVIAGIGFIKSKQTVQISNPFPLFIFGLLAVYYLLNGLVNTQGGINLRHYIIFVDTLLLFSLSVLLNNGKITFLVISKTISLIAAVESIICILQQFSIISSLDSLFIVTGSNVNPNVTAMFLAMAIPAIMLLLFDSPSNPIRALSPYRVMAITSFILCLVALAFLKCRTAFIGAVIGITLIINNRFQLIKMLKNKFSNPLLIIATALTFCFVSIALLFLYHSKQASTDGRLFIWKISLKAIAEKPIFGSGYGQFEHDYNLAQARYFAQKTATQQEIFNAGYVHMSYNEFLENLFEGGIIGLILFVGLLVTLFPCPYPLKGRERSPQKIDSKTNIGTLHNTPLRDGGFAFAGIATFVIMCFFNFTVQALPVRALFIIYAGVCCVERKSNLNIDLATFKKLPNLANANIFNKTPFIFVVTALSIFLFFKILTLSKAYSQCNTILETQNDLGSKEALQEMAALKVDLRQSTHYLHGYANLLFRTKHYDAAIEKYNQSLNYNTNPEIYMELGNCLTKRARYTEAEQAYTMAANIEPHRFAPKYGLMKIYAFAKDSINAKVMAQQIVAMNPKVESEKVEYYKREAMKLINN